MKGQSRNPKLWSLKNQIQAFITIEWRANAATSRTCIFKHHEKCSKPLPQIIKMMPSYKAPP
jgi:hypothetical protein